MNDAARRQAVREAAKPGFKGHTKRISKVKPLYPQSVEREFQRVTDAYLKLFFRILKKYLPEIREAAVEEEIRQDSLDDLVSIIRKVFLNMGIELEKVLSVFDLRRKLNLMANMTRKLSIREWKRAVHALLGINILDDYYLGEFYREALRQWVDSNVNLISTIPKNLLGQMENIVLDGFLNGRTTAAIVKEIEKVYGIGKRHARLIARDQLAKLNGELARLQQTDAGVTEYIWSDSGDVRVRDSHKHLNGKRFSWDAPPVVDARTGRRCHPGEDYQCRCVALPVFDLETLDLPISEKEVGGMT